MTNESAESMRWQSPASDIEVACVEFAASWRRGERPQIEVFLARVGPEYRAELLRRLLKIETVCRSSAGETADGDEYLSRFREFSDVVEMVLGSSNLSISGLRTTESPRLFTDMRSINRAAMRHCSMSIAAVLR